MAQPRGIQKARAIMCTGFFLSKNKKQTNRVQPLAALIPPVDICCSDRLKIDSNDLCGSSELAGVLGILRAQSVCNMWIVLSMWACDVVTSDGVLFVVIV